MKVFRILEHYAGFRVFVGLGLTTWASQGCPAQGGHLFGSAFRQPHVDRV